MQDSLNWKNVSSFEVRFAQNVKFFLLFVQTFCLAESYSGLNTNTFFNLGVLLKKSYKINSKTNLVFLRLQILYTI